MKKLSILIPTYNEEKTILLVLEKIKNVELDGLEKEVIIIDDYSEDNTEKVIKEYQSKNQNFSIIYFKQDKNKGKGAALHKGIKQATGDFLIIQDADLEYNPNEYNILLEPILEGVADVVYGTRFMGNKPHRVLFFWHSIGNKFLTFLSNIVTNLNLTDMETCYKAFKIEIIKSVLLKEKRFGFEPEVTAKIARIPNIKIYEVGISYYGRTYQEGKKINWKDGFRALYCIFKYGFLKMK
ncbi:glycosyl transferase [Bernardetia litoralis DSM 6794]|uniref:Glycosyl transferase n=1 Tax=Bernardetia litoralis (strain ATCC 23117 / DSM 6794 / NBRC 15988 / NCIMB 1366 / Fx l1 / Sio-4) TaxID=880071 RepID=I4AN36_BERLS|nr:glycosyltransferase [Bernardetia litoralis]AFM05371.1 glycosyl transferase [Bernardetia litoralis DSM 6794]